MLNRENEDFWRDLIELAFQQDNEQARYLLGRIMISLPEWIEGDKIEPNSDKQFLKNLLVAK